MFGDLNDFKRVSITIKKDVLKEFYTISLNFLYDVIKLFIDFILVLFRVHFIPNFNIDFIRFLHYPISFISKELFSFNSKTFYPISTSRFNHFPPFPFTRRTIFLPHFNRKGGRIQRRNQRDDDLS